MSILRFLITFLSLFFISFSLVNAATTVTRGPVSVNIHWDIVGGSGTCNGTTNYPGTTGDGLKSSWESSHSPSSGNMSVSQVNGDSGSSFPQTWTFWCQDASSGAISSDTLTINDCSGGAIWNGSSCVLNASCGGAHYACSAGSSINNSFDGSNTYTWTCQGSGGGSNASCHECTAGAWNGSSCVITPINGQCGGTAYSCSQGNSINNGGDVHNYTWTCQGSNGGSDASCSLAKCPVAPTASMSWSPATVSSGGFSTISWTTGGSNLTSCSFYIDGDNGSPARNTANGWPYNNNTPGWSEGPYSTSTTWSMTCVNSCTDTVNASAKLNYNDPPIANAGSDITIYAPSSSTSTGPSNGVAASDPNGTVASTVWSYVSFTNGSGSPSPSITNGNTLSPTFNGLTLPGTYTFRLTVTDNQASQTTDDMVVNVIPAAPVLSGGCALPGTTATSSWTASTGATKYELRVDDQANGWTGTCSSVNPGDICNDNYGSNSYSFSSTQDHTYNEWVHACNAVGCSASSNVVSYTCAKPITVTITQNPTVFLGDSATIKWTTDGDTCNIYDNTGTTLIKAVGAVTSPAQATLLNTDLAQTVNVFGYQVKCTDSTKPARGTGVGSATVTLECPRHPLSYNQVTASSCNNPTPSVTISPGAQKIVIGQSIDYTSVATDTTSDLTAHQFEWQKPDGTWSWVNPPQGSVSYTGANSFSGSPTSTNNLIAHFTPTLAGVYFVRFVTVDDTLNNPALSYIGAPNPKYYTVGGRLTYSSLVRLDVLNRVGAEIVPDSNGNLKWQCYNANYMYLESWNGSASTTVVSYRSIPPAFGTFTPAPNLLYYLKCETTQDSASVTYAMPTLSLNNTTSNTADIAFDCKNTTTQSATLQRINGMAPASMTLTASSSYIQGGLSPSTDYTYVLRCYDGPVVSGSVTGKQIGYATLDIRTQAAFVDPNPVVINAYIRAKGTDPTTSMTATTTDGTFYDWKYTITSGTAQACTMQQQNDSQGWYSNVPPDSNTLTYTFSWSSMLNSDKQAFVNSFTKKHDWKLTCVNPVGTVTTKTWSLVRAQASNPVIDTITQGTAPTLADITFRCVPASAIYTIRNSANTIVQSGPYTGPVTFSPTVADNYSVTCDNGPIVVVLVSNTMFDPIFRLTGTQRSIGNTTAATFTWDITNPDPSCRIWAEVTIPTSCDATCQANRANASTTINNQIQTGMTDANDPYWPNGNGSRTITQALTEAAYNTPNARGKATIYGIKYGTTFVGKCDNTPAVKVKIGVGTINEG